MTKGGIAPALSLDSRETIGFQFGKQIFSSGNHGRISVCPIEENSNEAQDIMKILFSNVY